MSQRVLVVNTHGLGDIVMMIPMIQALKSHGVQFGFVLKNSVSAELLNLLIPSLVSDAKFLTVTKAKQSRLRRLIGMVRFARQFAPDTVLPVFSQHPEKTALLALFSGAKSRVGFGGFLAFLNTINLPAETVDHKVAYNIDVARSAIPSADFTSRPGYTLNQSFVPDEETVQRAFALVGLGKTDLSNTICIAPGCGEKEAHKRWPVQYFAELADAIQRLDAIVIILGTKNERQLGFEIISRLQNQKKVINAIGILSLTETIALLSRSRGLICNCNGLSHIAAIIGTRVVGLYGPTDPAKTAPYGKHVKHVITSLDCAPCYTRGYTEGCGRPVCMKDIQVARVFAELRTSFGI